ncbi:MAG: UDP-3-O-(3-hydroxymyristoyl)glucosamine N-acyltransferase, partial [Acidobacteriota bacterium]|nr:UDP-3-O-(3-hydroxymyristoyl)glucosamine N-acyltransferase [Acidobacteriota bacterium]
MSRLEKTLQEVRKVIGSGDILGDPGFLCRSVASLENAGPEQLSFVRGRAHEEKARKSRAGALVVPIAVEGISAHQLVVEDAGAAFSRVLEVIAASRRRRVPGIEPTATVDPSAALGVDVAVGPGAVIGAETEIGDRCVVSANVHVGTRSKVGEDSVLHPNAVVMEDVTLGRRVVVHGGAVIGADGYGYSQTEGRHHKVPQVGEVVIGDDVEIGA